MGLALALLCVLRYGPRLDLFNPAWGFLLIFAVGLAHGLHPGLTPADSLRSLLGSAAPYAFAFSRLSRRWVLVEGGQLGRAALVALFALWAWRHTRPLSSAERAIMRLVFVALACHACTDNVLISTSACVLFAFCAAVFARGALEREAAGSA